MSQRWSFTACRGAACARVPVHKAGGIERACGAVVLQRLRMRARGQVRAVHELDERAHNAVQVGHLCVPAAHIRVV